MRDAMKVVRSVSKKVKMWAGKKILSWAMNWDSLRVGLTGYLTVLRTDVRLVDMSEEMTDA